MSDVKQRFGELRAAEAADPDQLDDLWAALSATSIDEVLGSWRGGDFATGHPASTLLTQVRWHGKVFNGPLDAKPLICRGEDGDLYSNLGAGGGGEASLWAVEFRGEVTATMVYDKMPVFDHFKRVDDDTLMGIMNGKLEDAFGVPELYYFWLERDV